MRLELNLNFKDHFAPENFFFGVASGPYSEGGINEPDGFKNTSWRPLEPGESRRWDEGTKLWTEHPTQIELAASLGLNAYRMGIEWSRCQPSSSTESLDDPPPWDEAALDHYADIIETVIDHGMQPIVTLHQFTHPLWLGTDIWRDDRGPDIMTDAQIHMVEAINTRLTSRGNKKMAHFIVYNEPNQVWAFSNVMKGNHTKQEFLDYLLPAYDTMLSHYIKAYDGLHNLFERHGWGTPHVGYDSANHCQYEIDKLLDDVLRLRSWGVKREDAVARIAECRQMWRTRIDDLAKSQLTDVQYDRYLKSVDDYAQAVPAGKLTKTLDALYASPREDKLDYISLNVYAPFSGVQRDPDAAQLVIWDRYPMDGELFRTFIHARNDFNTGLPVYMGENSCGNRQEVGGEAVQRPDRWTRERYLKTCLMEMVRCMKEGVPIRGYLYWSLVDCSHPWRLGLYNYDFVNHRIRETDGFGQPSGKIYAHLISALRSGDKARIADAFVNAYPPA